MSIEKICNILGNGNEYFVGADILDQLHAAGYVVVHQKSGVQSVGEGTKGFSAQDEIAEIKRRIASLEARGNSLQPMVNAHGCVCPAGAEAGCGSVFCPRRHSTWVF